MNLFNRLKRVKYLNLFLIISLTNTLIFFLINYLKDGYYIEQAMLSAKNQFSDYFLQLSLSFEPQNVYKSGFAPFPPFAYGFYYLLWMMNPTKNLEFMDWESFKFFENNLTVFLAYNVIQMILFVYITGKVICRESEGKRVLFLIAVVMSYPVFATSLQRGNSIF